MLSGRKQKELKREKKALKNELKEKKQELEGALFGLDMAEKKIANVLYKTPPLHYRISYQNLTYFSTAS